MINELEVFPQFTLSEAQGHVGVRRWTLDPCDDLAKFLRIVCKSHFPGYQDSIPVQIQTGGLWEGVVLTREHARTYETLGEPPKYGKTLVVAQYALHRMTNKWPRHLTGTDESGQPVKKPYHPPGTTLSVRVRGSGQFLLVSPAGMRTGTMNELLCTPGTESLSASVGTRIVIPITEYHLTCDRMTLEQVNDAMRTPSWDDYQGSVNKYKFMGAPPGTLLFDGYESPETFACDVDEPLRYSLTASASLWSLASDQPLRSWGIGLFGSSSSTRFKRGTARSISPDV